MGLGERGRRTGSRNDCRDRRQPPAPTTPEGGATKPDRAFVSASRPTPCQLATTFGRSLIRSLTPPNDDGTESLRRYARSLRYLVKPILPSTRGTSAAVDAPAARLAGRRPWRVSKVALSGDPAGQVCDGSAHGTSQAAARGGYLTADPAQASFPVSPSRRVQAEGSSLRHAARCLRRHHEGKARDASPGASGTAAETTRLVPLRPWRIHRATGVGHERKRRLGSCCAASPEMKEVARDDAGPEQQSSGGRRNQS